ncbi:MAG: hypothetical protein WBF73_11160 [Bradyrhizobium sp.]
MVQFVICLAQTDQDRRIDPVLGLLTIDPDHENAVWEAIGVR